MVRGAARALALSERLKDDIPGGEPTVWSTAGRPRSDGRLTSGCSAQCAARHAHRRPPPSRQQAFATHYCGAAGRRCSRTRAWRRGRPASRAAAPAPAAPRGSGCGAKGVQESVGRLLGGPRCDTGCNRSKHSLCTCHAPLALSLPLPTQGPARNRLQQLRRAPKQGGRHRAARGVCPQLLRRRRRRARAAGEPLPGAVLLLLFPSHYCAQRALRRLGLRAGPAGCRGRQLAGLGLSHTGRCVAAREAGPPHSKHATSCTGLARHDRPMCRVHVRSGWPPSAGRRLRRVSWQRPPRSHL